MDGISTDSCPDRSPQRHSSSISDQNQRSSSLASLIRDVHLALETNVKSKSSNGLDDAPNKNVQECLAILGDSSNFQESDENWDLSGESLSPQLPPKAFLQPSLETYFRVINPILPIFDKDCFYEGIEKNYGLESDQVHPAWIMCFNNTILQSLTASTASRLTEDPHGEASSMQGADIEAKIQSPFLTNLRRGMSRLERFHQTSLVSVQALTSMVIWPFLH